jgi:histone H3/H4
MSQTAFVRVSAVKEFNRQNEFRTDGELVDAVNQKIEQMLSAAQERAAANGRSTVRPYDL